MLRATLVVIGLLLLGGADRAPTPATAHEAGARVLVDSRRHRIFLELAPVDMPAHEMILPPIAILTLPVSGSLYGFHVEMVDSAGHLLPADLLHHFNLIDPDHRELFLPISRRMAAAGRETGALSIPWFLFGFPIKQGERVLASAMTENRSAVSYRAVRTRLVLDYVPAQRPWPLFRAAPFQLDVAFPVGDKSFDLPPGRSSRSYEGSPAVPGTIVAIGGHVHAYAERLELTDVTTGAVIYRVKPLTDSLGDILGVPIERLFRWNRLGVHIVPSDRYRVTVYYDNPTGERIPAGGMGVVGGLFVPDRGIEWPKTTPGDSLYQQDLRHAMRVGGGGHDMDMHMHMNMNTDHGMPHHHAP